MELRFDGRFYGNDPILDADLRDLEVVETASGRFLLAATGLQGGVSAFRLTDGAGLAGFVSSQIYGPAAGLGVGQVAAVSLDGSLEVILAGTGNGALVSFGLGTDAILSPAVSLDLPGQDGRRAEALAAISLPDGRSALYMFDAVTGTLRACISDGNGQVVADVAGRGGADAYAMGGQVLLETARAGGNSFLLAADGDSNGLRSYRVNLSTGELRVADSLGAADGLGINAPTALETVVAHGATWIILAAAGSSSLSVMRLDATGQMTPADHLLDTLATRFAGVTALKAVVAGEHAFVLAGGADDGISLFSLLPDGRLLHLQSLAQAPGLGLTDVSAIEASVVGSTLQIFVTSATTPGITQLSLPLAGLGAVIDPGPGAATTDPLTGTGGADILVGQGQTLNGGAGADILVSNSRGGALSGGAGADLFVLAPTDNPLKITDFEPGIDRIDLSAFPLLHDPGQLVWKPMTKGIQLRFGSTGFSVFSADGRTLTPDDLWPGGFDTADRVPLPTGPVWNTIPASIGDDRLRGTAGRDHVEALAGHDRISTGRGGDWLSGGAGRDTLFAGKGGDRLRGGSGRDDLHGGAGADRLRGGHGNDTLHGGRGDDLLTGGAGRDLFVFADNAGTDRITDFTPGTDLIHLTRPGLQFADLDIRADTTGTGTEIGAGAVTILLDGVIPGQITADDFLFG